MKEKERREEYALENLIQAAYDFSDDQLLAELEETEATLTESDFPGIEDRMFSKLKARLQETEATETAEVIQLYEETSEKEVSENAKNVEESDDFDRLEENNEASTEPEGQNGSSEPKVVRFGKKKAIVVGILAAAFVGALGLTAIGGKNYFFRDSKIEIGVTIDNDKNARTLGSLSEAYDLIEEKLGIRSLRFGYLPEEMRLKALEIINDRANFEFVYDEKVIYFIQEQLGIEASVGVNSDRDIIHDSIYNEWITEYFVVEEEVQEDGSLGYAATLNIDNTRYYLTGRLGRSELEKIIKYLNFN